MYQLCLFGCKGSCVHLRQEGLIGPEEKFVGPETGQEKIQNKYLRQLFQQLPTGGRI